MIQIDDDTENRMRQNKQFIKKSSRDNKKVKKPKKDHAAPFSVQVTKFPNSHRHKLPIWLPLTPGARRRLRDKEIYPEVRFTRWVVSLGCTSDAFKGKCPEVRWQQLLLASLADSSSRARQPMVGSISRSKVIPFNTSELWTISPSQAGEWNFSGRVVRTNWTMMARQLVLLPLNDVNDPGDLDWLWEDWFQLWEFQVVFRDNSNWP